MRVNANGVAAIRALTLVFFAATAFYGILAFSPFAYNQFIRPNLIPWLGWSVTFYGGLFLGVLSVTLLTLLADVERPATRAVALGTSRSGASWRSGSSSARSSRRSERMDGAWRSRRSRSLRRCGSPRSITSPCGAWCFRERPTSHRRLSSQIPYLPASSPPGR